MVIFFGVERKKLRINIYLSVFYGFGWILMRRELKLIRFCEKKNLNWKINDFYWFFVSFNFYEINIFRKLSIFESLKF